jgi:hypothetical protein
VRRVPLRAMCSKRKDGGPLDAVSLKLMLMLMPMRVAGIKHLTSYLAGPK